MRNEARAVWFTSPESVAIRSLPLCPVEEGEVLVRSTYSGVSPGTEMLAYRGELDPDLPIDETIGALSGTFRYPFRFGYSVVGVVEQSRSSISEGTQVFAFHPHQDRFSVAAADLIPMDGFRARQATLFPLVETAFQITLDAGLEAGDRVTIMGLGPVGALTALLMARSGVDVIGVDPLPWRRAALEAVGQDGLRVVALESVRASAEAEGWTPVKVVIEASGNPDAASLGLRLLSHEGTLMVASWYGTRDVAMPLGREFHRRRLSITSTQVSTIPARLAGEWDKLRRRAAVAELMAELPLSLFATHTFPFESASEAYAAIHHQREGLVHAALAYG